MAPESNRKNPFQDAVERLFSYDRVSVECILLVVVPRYCFYNM